VSVLIASRYARAAKIGDGFELKKSSSRLAYVGPMPGQIATASSSGAVAGRALN
jgi:hypothetical protein